MYAFVDMGMNEYAYHSFRLEGYDAPEIFSGPAYVRVWGEATKEKLVALLAVGTPVLLTTMRDAQTFGRYRADVKTVATPSVNAAMRDWMYSQLWWPEYEAYKEGT